MEKLRTVQNVNTQNLKNTPQIIKLGGVLAWFDQMVSQPISSSFSATHGRR